MCPVPAPSLEQRPGKEKGTDPTRPGVGQFVHRVHVVVHAQVGWHASNATVKRARAVGMNSLAG